MEQEEPHRIERSRANKCLIEEITVEGGIKGQSFSNRNALGTVKFEEFDWWLSELPTNRMFL
jgi:hypothetical protein